MRTLSLLATDEVQGLLQRLVEPISSEEYRATMTNLGEQFGRSLDTLLSGVKNLLLVCTNEDADFLARGVLRGLGSFQGPSVALACFWNDRVRLEGTTDLSVELAPIVRKYVEPGECDAILVLKSIIASGCVVRTNITEIIHDRNPDRVLIFSPVVLKGADDRLREEFDSDIARRFEFFWFAEDTETNDQGEVVPGVGGNVYERLGLASEKTRYVPELVKERRQSAKSLARPPQLPVTPLPVPAHSDLPLKGAAMGQPRILIIEDERGLTQTLSWYFNREGFETIIAHDGAEGLRKAQTLLPEIILLDIMLPGMNGLDVCRELRNGERTRELRIIMLTHLDKVDDQFVGYVKGADLYITKPFNNNVLLQEVKALLRWEVPGELGDVIEHAGVRIDRVRHLVTVLGEAVDLPPTEFKLLLCLLRQPGRAFNRHQLMDAAIGEGSIVLDRTIDVHVKSLRQKLTRAGGSADLIETVRGVGYRFCEAEGKMA
jgi:two-component system phosphate regulon response regulator PhoB